MNKFIKRYFYQILIVLLAIVFFLPFLTNPEILTYKNNDLGRNYIPLFTFLEKSYENSDFLPLWRADQMMGETVIGSPLIQPLYPANTIFLFVSVNLGSVLYLLLHFIVAGLSTFYLSKSFSLPKRESFAAAIFYMFSIKTLTHFEAGHATMVAAFSLFPLAFLSLRKVNYNKYQYFLTGAVSLSLIYLSYPTIFYYSIIFLFFYEVYYFLRIRKLKKEIIRKVFFSIAMVLTSLGLLAIVLFPQLEFGPLSTRSDLKLEDVAIPIWNSRKFAEALIFPYFSPSYLTHEELLYLGLVPTLLVPFAFFSLNKFQKITLLVFAAITVLFVLGTSTPFFETVYKYLPLLKYSRVTTRLWFVVALLSALLAAVALSRIKRSYVTYIAIFVFIAEVFSLTYFRLSKISSLPFTNEKLYQDIAKDGDIFRVYCTTYCFNPQLLQKYDIQTLNGENPIQQKSFVDLLKKAGNYNYQGFTVIFPPYQAWQEKNPPKPNARLLGQANVKYIVSTYPMHESSYFFLNSYEGLLLYLNKDFRPRAYFENSSSPIIVTKLTNQNISLSFTPSSEARNIIYSENFYPGWLEKDGNNKQDVTSYQGLQRLKVSPGTSQINLAYNPKSFKIGLIITIFTLFASACLFGIVKNINIHGKNRYLKFLFPSS